MMMELGKIKTAFSKALKRMRRFGKAEDSRPIPSKAERELFQYTPTNYFCQAFFQFPF
jgi:hypothetical protein